MAWLKVEDEREISEKDRECVYNSNVRSKSEMLEYYNLPIYTNYNK